MRKRQIKKNLAKGRNEYTKLNGPLSAFSIKRGKSHTIKYVPQDSTSYVLRGKTQDGLVFDFPCMQVGLPNMNGTIYSTPPVLPENETILVEGELDRLRIEQGCVNPVSMGFTFKELEPVIIINSRLLNPTVAVNAPISPVRREFDPTEFVIIDDPDILDLNTPEEIDIIAEEKSLEFQREFNALEDKDMQERLSTALKYHAERVMAEPCVHCGHPADAHGGPCKYPVYDTEPGPGDSEIYVEGSMRECGCTNFLGITETGGTNVLA
jgi:hypothetical protein